LADGIGTSLETTHALSLLHIGYSEWSTGEAPPNLVLPAYRIVSSGSVSQLVHCPEGKNTFTSPLR